MPISVCYFTSKDDNDIRVFHKECVSLVKAGYDVTMVCPNAKCRIHQGVRIIGVEYNGKTERERFIVLPKLLFKKALEVNADIYQFNDPASISYGSKLKRMGKKVIFDAFEDHPSMWMNRGTGLKRLVYKFVGFVYKQYEMIKCKEFDAAIVCYHWTRDQFKKVNDNVELVLNFPLIDRDKVKERPLRTTNDIKICYAGTISDAWNIPTLINAIENLNDVKFNLAGWTDDELMGRMKSLIGWEKVNYFGKLPKQEVNEKVYSHSDIGVALYHYSPLCKGKIGNMSNNKLFEYLLMGMPVICTDFDLWKEVVEKNHCGICVNPSDANAIMEAIVYIQKNQKEAYQMGLNGQKAVLAEYNWDSQERILFSVYEKIVNK